MRLPRPRHRWDVTPKEAVAIQRRLAGEVRVEPFLDEPRLVAGADAAFSPDGRHLIAGWVTWDIRTRAVIEKTIIKTRVTFPYVPGLLSFREAPGLLAAAAKLQVVPDVFLIDGQGLAHPRRFGIACHVGLLLDRPTIGCAKSLLCGEHAEPAARRGSSTRLVHQGDVIGRAVRTREGVKPVYVSVGHRITLVEAVKWVLRSCTKYRLPEPARLAHQLVTTERNQNS